MSRDLAREAVLTAERFADGEIGDAERRTAAESLRATYPPRMTPDNPVPVPYLAGMVAFYCAWSNHVSPRPGVHSNIHGTEAVAGWSRFTLVLAETKLWEHSADYSVQVAEAGHQCRLLRDIFGNPFRSIAFSPSWRTGMVRALAHTIYEAREFSAMPILADALQDAGCEDVGLLGHRRSPRPHVRGCRTIAKSVGVTQSGA